MPKLIDLPNGAVGEFPDDMSNEAITAALAKQFPSPKGGATGSWDDAKTGSWDDKPSLRETIEDVASRYWQGVKGGANRAYVRALDVPPPKAGRPMVSSPEQRATDAVAVQPNRDALAAYKSERASGSLGTAGELGDATPGMIASAVPIARAGEGIAAFPLAAKALGRFAPAAGDIAANAGYSAATADPGQAGSEALLGGAGAAGGRVFTRTLAGLKPLLSKPTQALIDSGVTPTPGQMFGPLGRAAEEVGSQFPGVGNVIDYGRKRALGQYTTAEIDRALAPLGKTAKELGGSTVEDTVAKAEALVSQAFDQAAPRTFIPSAKALTATQKAVQEVGQIPLLTEQQQKALGGYIEQKVLPAVQSSTQQGADIPGRVAKDLDIELGTFARKFENSPNPADAPLGKAFRVLQKNLRAALEGADPEAKELLANANSAYRNMLPVIDASSKAAGKMGQFSPTQFNKAAGKFGQDAGELNAAARQQLPAPTGNSSLGRVVTGVGGASLGHLGTLAAGTGIAAALYNPASLHLMVNGLGGLLPEATKRYMATLPPRRAADYLIQLGQRFPHLQIGIQQVASQMGRQAATQPEEVQ